MTTAVGRGTPAIAGEEAVQERDTAELRSLMGRSDFSLAEVIKDRLPAGTYTAVYVTSVPRYPFAGFAEEIDARLISLTITKTHMCASLFFAFFAGVGLIDGAKLESRVDKAGLQKELLHQICGSSGGIVELEKAYAQCTDIDLYIAVDLKAIELKLRERSCVIVTYKVTQVTKKILQIAIPVIAPIVLGAVAGASK